MIEAQRSLAPGDNVIQKGDDVKKGETLLSMGRRLRPQDVAVLGGIGICEPDVFERPRVAIISTGDEIVSPSEPVSPGKVRDMNSFNLAGLVLEDNGIPVKFGILQDEYNLIEKTVRRALEETDMVLVSGGSSVGARDLTERIFEALGEVLFHSVTLKPGKPLLAGLAGGKLMFGLPGHPRAVSVCYELFVRPALKRLSGETPGEFDALCGSVRARLAHRVHSSPGRQENINVTLEWKGKELWARPLLWKSGLLSCLVRAHGTMTVPLEKLGYEEGEEVDVRLS
jgi:molybdopterin molybdotransferase